MVRFSQKDVFCPSRRTQDGSLRPFVYLLRLQAFTLVELMVVILIIVMLAAISMGVASYVQQHVALTTTKAQIAAFEAAIELYKNDFGYYPASMDSRLSNRGTAESINNSLLYRALFEKGKRYVNFPAAQIRLNPVCAPPLTNMYDTWGSVFVYYNSPATPYAVSNNLPDPVTGTNTGYTLGGQINSTTYDLFSYGSDRLTFIPGAKYNNGNFSGWYRPAWTSTNSALDDVANWGK